MIYVRKNIESSEGKSGGVLEPQIPTCNKTKGQIAATMEGEAKKENEKKAAAQTVKNRRGVGHERDR